MSKFGKKTGVRRADRDSSGFARPRRSFCPRGDHFRLRWFRRQDVWGRVTYPKVPGTLFQTFGPLDPRFGAETVGATGPKGVEFNLR